MAQELPYAAGAALKRKRRKKKRLNEVIRVVLQHTAWYVSHSQNDS